MHCRVSLGKAVCIAFAPSLSCVRVGCLGLSSATRGIGLILCGAGILPCVLFWVTCWWSLGVIFNTRLVVEFCDFMIGSASVMHGIVMMGVSSSTLCSSSHVSCCLAQSTLCSCGIGGGVSRSLTQVPRSLINRLPLGVLFASAVCLVNSSVRARKCWWRVNASNWQSFQNNSVNLEIW